MGNGRKEKRQPHCYREAATFPPGDLLPVAPLPVDPAATSSAKSDADANVSGWRQKTPQLGMHTTKPTATPAPKTL